MSRRQQVEKKTDPIADGIEQVEKKTDPTADGIEQVEKKTDPTADGIEHGFDAAHRVADSVVGSLGLKPVDSVIHGTAQGLKNWLACNDDKDEPSQRNKGSNNMSGNSYCGNGSIYLGFGDQKTH